jgi:putative peptidoglycan lipid II flippase
VKRGEWALYSSRLGRTLQSILLATIPVAVFSMIAGEEIVALLFKRGDFSNESVHLTAAAFFWHQSGLAFIAANRVIAPAFYARSDSKTPAWAGIASFAVNVLLVSLLAYPFKGPGIAFALSFSSVVNTVILVAVLLRRNAEGIKPALEQSALYGLKLLAFSLLSSIPVVILRAPLLSVFASSRTTLVSAGLPLFILAILYGMFGIGLLVLTKDSVAASITSAVGGRRPK